MSTRKTAPWALGILLSATAAGALAGAPSAEMAELHKEIEALKASYETRISQLEKKLAAVQSDQAALHATVVTAQTTPTPAAMPQFDNRFNPAISAVLSGSYASFSQNSSTIAGFGTPEEGARGAEGFSLGESEIIITSAIDDKFAGTITLAVESEDGEDSMGIEEAYISNLPGMQLPAGLGFRAGRALWTLGYLNEHHAHEDDFVDRPLPYRVFIDHGYNDDGVEINWTLPTDMYAEVGGGLFRGSAYPFGDNDDAGAGAWSVYGRIGGDIGDNQSWRAGAYRLTGNANNRLSNEDAISFIGDSTTYISDFRYSWAPTGNNRERELTLQGEYFWRTEDGIYEDFDIASGIVPVNDSSSGWYVQSVYRFLPQWKAGIRYSELQPFTAPVALAGSALDANGYNPHTWGIVTEWSNSEFSKFQLQFNREEVSDGTPDNQIILRYVMSMGAHGAHKY